MDSASKPFGVVYLITNTVNGKVYVGQTINGLSKRWKGHKNDVRKGSQNPLHRAIRCTGRHLWRYGMGLETHANLNG